VGVIAGSKNRFHMFTIISYPLGNASLKKRACKWLSAYSGLPLRFVLSA